MPPSPKRKQSKRNDNGSASAVVEDTALVNARTYPTEIVPISSLRPHPRNYRQHPDDQLDHIAHSIREYGIYRNIIVAREGTILAGHGVVRAANREGWTAVPVVRLNLEPDDPRALKLLAGDNEIGRLAEVDDRLLTEILKDLKDSDLGLVGTGFDEAMLAALLFNTRPASEIKDFDAAAEWAGMPGYEDGTVPIKLVVGFRNEEDRSRFVEQNGLRIDKTVGSATWSTRWPWTEHEDVHSVKFESAL